MIIKRNRDLQQIIGFFHRTLFGRGFTEHEISIALARSQGFEDLESLVRALPIMALQPYDNPFSAAHASCSRIAEIQKEIEYRDYTEATLSDIRPFPIAAESDHALCVTVNFIEATVSPPFSVHLSRLGNSDIYHEYLYEITLPAAILTKEEYEEMVATIRPAVRQLSCDYRRSSKY